MVPDPGHFLIRRISAGLHRALLRIAQPWRLRLWGLLRRQVTGVMVLGFTGDGRLVLVRHSYHLRDQWQVPGGGRARGEDVIATAVREVAEEVGGVLHDAVHFARVDRAMPGGWTNRIELVSGRISGDLRADGREIVAVARFAPDALPPDTAAAVHDFLALRTASER